MSLRTATSRPSAALLGIASVLTAYYIGAWPYPHPILNAAYAFWIVGAVAMFVGYRSVKRHQKIWRPPEDVEGLKAYRWLVALGVVAVLVLPVLFLVPPIISALDLTATACAVALVLGWAASMIYMWLLARYRRAWVRLGREGTA